MPWRTDACRVHQRRDSDRNTFRFTLDKPGSHLAGSDTLRPMNEALRLEREEEAMEDVMPSQVKVEVAGGFVDPIERSRAQAIVASVCRRSRSARGRVVLCARTDPLGSATASADAILVLDDYRLLSAGAVGASTRDAIDELGARLYRQVGELGSGNRRCASSSGTDGTAHELARAGKPRS